MNYEFVVHQKDGEEYLKLFFGKAVAEHERFRGLAGEYLIIEKQGKFLIGRKEEKIGKGKKAKSFTYQILFDIESGQVLDRSFTSGTVNQNEIGIEAFFEKAAIITRKKDFSMKHKRQVAFDEATAFNERLETAVLEKRMTRKQANAKIKKMMSEKDVQINSFLKKL